MRVGRKPTNGQWEDFTDERIATIKGEIASIEKTIQFAGARYAGPITENSNQIVWWRLLHGVAEYRIDLRSSAFICG